MTIRFNKNRFNREELEWAISLMEAEFEKKERNTPEKMSRLIRANFDIECDAQDIANYFGLTENYESENNRVHYGYHYTNREGQNFGLVN